MNEIANQISAMIGDLELKDKKVEPIIEEKKPKLPAPGVDEIAKGISNLDTEEETTEESFEQEEEEDVEEESEEESEEGEEGEEGEETLDEVSLLKQEVAALKKRLDPPKDEAKEEEEESTKFEPVQFLSTEEDYDKALASKDDLDRLLNRVAAYVHDKTIESVFRRIPRIINNEVSRETSQQQLVVDFFNKNRDLVPHRKYVAYEFNNVLAEDPSVNYPEALERTATKVRESLSISGQRKGKIKKKGATPPSLPGGSRVRTVPKKPSGIGSELSRMAKI